MNQINILCFLLRNRRKIKYKVKKFMKKFTYYFFAAMLFFILWFVYSIFFVFDPIY